MIYGASEVAISARGLSKSYGEHEAVAGIDVEIAAARSSRPGQPTREWRSRVGLVLQECELDPLLTVREAISLFATSTPPQRPVDETIDLTGLAEIG